MPSKLGRRCGLQSNSNARATTDGLLWRLTAAQAPPSLAGMLRLRRHKRVLGWLAAIALLGNMLVAALLVPSMATALVDDVLGPIVICTADGAKGAPEGGSGSGGHAPSNHCPACVTVAQFALVVAIVLTAVVFPLLPAARPARLQACSLALHLSLGGIRSRAPPLSA